MDRLTMEKRTCSIEGCDKRHKAHGWCGMHYDRWRRTGDVQAHIPAPIPSPQVCSIEGCEGSPRGRGWCRRHYRRWQAYGDPLGISPQQPCAWPDGCDRIVWVNKSRSGMCAPHAARLFHRQYKKDNAKRVNEGNRRYARQHPERVSEWNKKWRDANPEKQREYRLERIAREQGAFVERVYRSVVFKRDKGRCGLCGKKVNPEDWHLDHVVPLSRGGAHSYANVQVTHPFCNVSKGARLIEHQLALL